jgi:hypothetical protein
MRLRRKLKPPVARWDGSREKYHWTTILRYYTQYRAVRPSTLRGAFLQCITRTGHLPMFRVEWVHDGYCLDNATPYDPGPTKPPTVTLKVLKSRGTVVFDTEVSFDFSDLELRLAAVGISAQEAAESLRRLSNSFGQCRALALADLRDSVSVAHAEPQNTRTNEPWYRQHAGRGKFNRRG